MKRFLFNGRLFFSMEDLHCDINYQNFKHALYTRLDIVVLTIRLLYIFCTYNPFTLYFKFPGEEAHILKEATWHAWSTNWKPKAPYILLWLNNYIEPLDQRVFFLINNNRKTRGKSALVCLRATESTISSQRHPKRVMPSIMEGTELLLQNLDISI